MKRAAPDIHQISLPGDVLPEPGLTARLYSSDLFILLGAVLVSVVLPEMVHEELAMLGRLFLAYPQVPEPSLLAAIAATLVIHAAIRSIWRMPLTHSPAFILGTVVVSYGLAAAALKLAAVSIGFYHFWTGMLGAAAWYLFVAGRRRTLLRPLVGLIGPRVPADRLLSLPIHCLILTRPILHPQVTALAVTGPLPETEGWITFLAKAARGGMPVYQFDELAEEVAGRLDHSAMMAGNFGCLSRPGDWLTIKRLMDLILCLAAMPIILLLLAALWLPFKLSTPGPLLQRKLCLGCGGKPFLLLSFASSACRPGLPVRSSSGDTPQPSSMGTGDATSIGKLSATLERWGLSDLPAIWNVLMGDLSWVGPRPMTPDEVQDAGPEGAFLAYRQAVRPGLTGWALACLGKSGTVGRLHDELAHDYFYVKHTGLWLDCIVLVKTLGRLRRRLSASR
jgi:lipopolysaccharide/colanic/teichoic acid biosynthesis glycosyltransferase